MKRLLMIFVTVTAAALIGAAVPYLVFAQTPEPTPTAVPDVVDIPDSFQAEQQPLEDLNALQPVATQAEPTPIQVTIDPTKTTADPDPRVGPHVPTIAELTPALLSALVAGLLSLVFRFVPGAVAWFDQKDATQKQLFMLVATVLIGAAIGGYNIAKTGLDEASLIMLALTIYASVTSNQVTYQYIKGGTSSPKPMFGNRA